MKKQTIRKNDNQTINNIFRLQKDRFLHSEDWYHLSDDQRKAFTDIVRCCSNTGPKLSVIDPETNEEAYEIPAPCGSRNCPGCGNNKATDWYREKSFELLLHIPYQHLVFTLPPSLHTRFKKYPKVCYSLFQKAVWLAVQEYFLKLSAEHAEVGSMMITHTWNSRLRFHFHVHCYIPKIFVYPDLTWKPFDETIQMDVDKLRSIFRKRLNGLLMDLFPKNYVPKIPDTAPYIYIKAKNTDLKQALNYIKKFMFRVGISPKMITNYDDHSVTFKAGKDTSPGEKPERKCITLPSIKFILKHLQHVFPKGVHKYKQYGFLGNRNKEKIKKIRDSILRSKGFITEAYDQKFIEESYPDYVWKKKKVVMKSEIDELLNMRRG